MRAGWPPRFDNFLGPFTGLLQRKWFAPVS